jgi:hypothetical protein
VQSVEMSFCPGAGVTRGAVRFAMNRAFLTHRVPERQDLTLLRMIPILNRRGGQVNTLSSGHPANANENDFR